MEIALERDNFEVLVILASFAEVPEDKCLDFLGTVVKHEGEEQYAAEFKKNLEGLSVSEVGLLKRLQIRFQLPGAGEVVGLGLAPQV